MDTFKSRVTSDSVGCANKSGSDTVVWDGYMLFCSVSNSISPGGYTIIPRGDDCECQQQYMRFSSRYGFYCIIVHCYKTCRLPGWASVVQKVRECVSQTETNSDSNRTWRVFHPNSAWAFFSILDCFSLPVIMLKSMMISPRQ